MTYKRPYLRSPANYDGNARDAQYTGKDYWTNTRLELDGANEEFARKMNGRKYEDDGRAR